MYAAICLCDFGPERCLCQQKNPALVAAAIFWAVCTDVWWVTVAEHASHICSPQVASPPVNQSLQVGRTPVAACLRPSVLLD
jgi:hypothetical protein